MKRLSRVKVLSVPGLAFLFACALMVPKVFGYSVDYLAVSISPAASFNGASGNFTLINDVSGGTDITFNLTFSIGGPVGSTTFPKIVTFGRTNVTKPVGADDPTVTFGPAPGTATTSCTFLNALSSCTVGVTVTAPATPGAYTVKIAPTAGTGGPGGLGPGGGIVVGFTVVQGCAPSSTDLALSVVPACIVVGSTNPVTFAATLTSGGSPLSGKAIDFTIDANAVGSGNTDDDGIASQSYDASTLTVGDHTVVASFQGEQCSYDGSSASANLGVTYAFLGFQPPVQIEGAGVGLFAGKVIPVKIRISDANGGPVTDAEPHVFSAPTSASLDSEEAADSIASTAPDGGNTMRYDPLSDQYVFNWDVSRLTNGYYNIRIDLGEGSCGEPHMATVNIQKKGGKK